jgi:[ribosomal protein S18]-alanine N-acetyltransferase
MLPLPIRSARHDDIDAIMALEAHGFHATIRESRDVMLKRLRHFPEGFLVLENVAGEPIGYLCSEIWSDRTPDHDHFALGHDIAHTHRPDGQCLYVSSMTIHPEQRGGGLGRQFFQQSVALIRNRLPHLEDSVLMVSAEWRGAHRIYQTCGYTEIARLNGFFAAIAQQDADAVVMKRTFTADAAT